ncbi:MAG TPA: 2-C-methyl-D-erythritol 2,4-cyclodiphosphate synthase [Pseudothermotoga sp.]
MNLRVGLGTDRHPFKKDRKFILGGVQIDFPLGLDGHSDADVLCHAVIDSLLGAASLQDIGVHFPEIDEWKDASSLQMLVKTTELLRKENWQIVNIDTTVICGAVRLSEYRDQMIVNLSKAMQIPKECISIKFKSSNHLGFESNEGISAIAVCLISRNSAS